MTQTAILKTDHFSYVWKLLSAHFDYKKRIKINKETNK